MFFDPVDKEIRTPHKDLNSPATIFPAIPAGTLKTYSFQGKNDGLPPRGLRPDADGLVELVDWADNTVQFNVLKGEPLDVMPKKITANTTVILHALY